MQKAVIVEVKKGINRADGSKLRFDRNACVLVSDKGDASDIRGPWSVESCCSAMLFAQRRTPTTLMSAHSSGR